MLHALSRWWHTAFGVLVHEMCITEGSVGVHNGGQWGTMGDNGGQWGTMAQHIRVRNACLIGTLYLKGEILASLHHMEAMLHDRCHKRAIDLV
jgi:hypothetical protein